MKGGRVKEKAEPGGSEEESCWEECRSFFLEERAFFWRRELPSLIASAHLGVPVVAM